MQVGAASAYAIAPPPERRRAEPAATAAGEADAATAPSATRQSPLQAEQERLQDPAVRAQLNALRNRDREVRAHEQAHMAAGAGVVTSGPSYTYQTGPDGKRYAIGGEVGIDASPVRGDPEATIRKAQQIRAAALAPGEPSAQDLRVAAQATQMQRTAEIEIARRERQAAEYAVAGRPATEASRGSLLSAVA